jgi:hypothetical protein
VLLTALLLPLVAPRTPLAVPVAHAQAPPPEAIVVSAVIEHPAYAAALISRPAQTVIAPAGATASSLATAYHVDAAAIRWANNLGAGAEPAPGTQVLIPPGPGALIRVRGGERPSQFARRLHIDPRVILDYNRLDTDAPLAGGRFLQVPAPLAPSGSLNPQAFIPSSVSVGVPTVAPNHGYNSFPYGQCTWYVANRRDVTAWGGNAIAWWGRARPYRPEGRIPIAGAIIVFDYPWVGHVGYVESVSPDGGSFLISEMNYYMNGGGWGRVDQRVIPTSDSAIVGFIY